MKFKLVAAVLVAGALACAPVRAQDAGSVLHSDLVEVLSATNAALGAQSAFNLARAANDTEAAKDAAAALLITTGAAAFWSKVLHHEATTGSPNAEIAAIAAELNGFAANAFNRIAPVVLEGDMAGLDRALDESADTLTGLANAMRRLVLSMGAG